MKKFNLLILVFLLTVLYCTSQVSSISEDDEIIKFKKEFRLDIKSEIDQSYISEKSANANEESIINDFGNPPGWDWVETYGGSGKDIARKVVVAEDGNLFITGSFSGEMSIESNNYTSVGSRDSFLAKFQANGSLVWFHQFSPLPNEKIDAYDIHLDTDENIYFTGYFTGDVSFGDFDLAAAQTKNLFLAVANPDGEITLATIHPTGNPEELGLKVDTDINGNIFVLGSTDGTTNYLHPSVIIKYAPDGSVISEYSHNQCWADMKVFGESIYYVGTFNTPDYIGDFYLEPRLYNDAFIARSNTNFEFSWAEIAGHGENNYGDSRGLTIFVSDDENIYTMGDFRSNILWDDIEVLGNGGFLTKCTSNGDFLWAKETVVNEFDYPSDISGNISNIFVTTYYKELQGNPLTTNQVRIFNVNNGDLANVTTLDNLPKTINYSPIDNALLITQNADELIQISSLDGTTFNSKWSVLFGGNSASAYSIGMDVDQYGSLYNFAYASNEINYFGQTINKGLFLAKQDGTGSTIWAVQFLDADMLSNYTGNKIVVDTVSNSIYIAGIFYNPLSIPVGPTLIPDYFGSIYVMKYDFYGNYQWAIQEDLNSFVISLASDYSGNILLSGTFTGSVDIGGTQLVSAGYEDVFIIKYNALGEHLWARRAGGEDTEYEGYVSTDSQDNVYLAGEFLSMNVTVDSYPFTMEEGDGNILFAKLDEQGNTLWVTAKGGSIASPIGDHYGWPTAIHTDQNGYSYIKGWHFDQAHFDDIVLNSAFDKPDYNNKWNKFTAKFDPDGNTIWANTISELVGSMDYNQFDVDQEGNVYTGLRVRDTIIFGEEYMYINSAEYDLVVAKYTNDGNLDWVKSIKNTMSGTTWLSSVVCYNEASVYVGGWFTNYLDFGTTSFTVNNKTGFIGLLGEPLGNTVYQQDDELLVFDLFPNPANDFLNIVVKEQLSNDAELFITDITGRTIWSHTMKADFSSTTIDLSGYSSGVYFTKLKSGKKVSVQKFVVE